MLLLLPVHAGNDIVKFADDTYLIIPASNTDTSAEELAHVQSWASCNNLQLNCKKSQEIIFQSTQKKPLQLPLPCPGITRVNSLSALGVVINNRLTAADHCEHYSVVMFEYDVRTPRVARSRYATQLTT